MREFFGENFEALASLKATKNFDYKTLFLNVAKL